MLFQIGAMMMRSLRGEPRSRDQGTKEISLRCASRDVLGLPLKFESPRWTEFATDGATLALHASEGSKAEEDNPQEPMKPTCLDLVWCWRMALQLNAADCEANLSPVVLPRRSRRAMHYTGKFSGEAVAQLIPLVNDEPACTIESLLAHLQLRQRYPRLPRSVVRPNRAR
jgi:hypothetical protein